MHCGEIVANSEHITWNCKVVDSHRKFQGMRHLEPAKLPTCIKYGFPSALDADFDGPFWGMALQPEGCVPLGVGAPPNSSEAFGATCDNRVLSIELTKKNLCPLLLNARQAFMCLKQNLEKPHVVIPYR